MTTFQIGAMPHVFDWCVWGKIKDQFVRTESFDHLRTQLLRVVADLNARCKLDPTSSQAHFLRRSNPCIAQKGMRFEHLPRQHKRKNIVEKLTTTSVEDADQL